MNKEQVKFNLKVIKEIIKIIKVKRGLDEELSKIGISVDTMENIDRNVLSEETISRLQMLAPAYGFDKRYFDLDNAIPIIDDESIVRSLKETEKLKDFREILKEYIVTHYATDEKIKKLCTSILGLIDKDVEEYLNDKALYEKTLENIEVLREDTKFTAITNKNLKKLIDEVLEEMNNEQRN